MNLRGFLLLACLLESAAAAAPEVLVVHEWGTFTSLQDERGRALGGINNEDEPLPKFAHDIDHLLVLRKNQLPPYFYQGAPQSLPAIVMRLETPVIYFYPPAESKLPLTLDVNVAFRGGWLTQYYPDAEVQAPGAFKELTPATVGRLSWRGLKVGVSGSGPKTSEHVWTAPRAVRAAPVMTHDGECEKFLFYRGVGNVDAPFRVVRDETGGRLSLFAQLQSWPLAEPPVTVRHLWLASFRDDGSAAFRRLAAVTAGNDAKELLSTAAAFRDAEYGRSNLDALRAEMRAALVAEGLFVDEANALLNTWELSYFKSAGLRLFFLMPRAWTDFRLPLEVSVPAEMKRVMVGRIELVTPEHRKLLRQLADGPAPSQAWGHREMVDGRPVLRGVMPAAYRDLGRFRNALLLDELQQRRSAALQMFAALNGLDNYRIEDSP